MKNSIEIAIISLMSFQAICQKLHYQNASLKIEQRVDDLLGSIAWGCKSWIGNYVSTGHSISCKF